MKIVAYADPIIMGPSGEDGYAPSRRRTDVRRPKDLKDSKFVRVKYRSTRKETGIPRKLLRSLMEEFLKFEKNEKNEYKTICGKIVGKVIYSQKISLTPSQKKAAEQDMIESSMELLKNANSFTAECGKMQRFRIKSGVVGAIIVGGIAFAFTFMYGSDISLKERLITAAICGSISGGMGYKMMKAGYRGAPDVNQKEHLVKTAYNAYAAVTDSAQSA